MFSHRSAENDDLPPLEDLNVDDLDYNFTGMVFTNDVFKVTWLVVRLHDQVMKVNFYQKHDLAIFKYTFLGI